MINWRIQPKPADKTILLHVSCEEDGTTPRRIEVKFDLGNNGITSESDNRLHLFWLLASWVNQYRGEEKTKPAPTRGRDFTTGLYFYDDGRPIEMRNNTGDNELVKKFVSVTMDWLLDEKSSIQLKQMEN